MKLMRLYEDAQLKTIVDTLKKLKVQYDSATDIKIKNQLDRKAVEIADMALELMGNRANKPLELVPNKSRGWLVVSKLLSKYYYPDNKFNSDLKKYYDLLHQKRNANP